MNKFFKKALLLCSIFTISILHAMDDAHKIVDLENANKELLQDVDFGKW